MEPSAKPRAPPTSESAGAPFVRLRSGTPSNTTHWPSSRVLLIEDNKWDADLTQQLLREAGQSGFVMEWAERLTDGLLRIAQGDIDLVLLDLSLPDSRGLSTVAKLRVDAPQIPLIVLTGLEDESIGTEAIKLGAEDYLVKGRYDGNLLVRAMRYAIERHRFQQERRAALEWKKELDHLREVDRLRTLFMGANSTPATSAPESWTSDATSTPSPEEHQAQLVDQLVEIAQIQDGTATLAREHIDLRQTVREIADDTQPLAERHRLSLEVFDAPELPVDVDPLRIIQILRSVLGNAVKFTGPGGRILVEMEAREGLAVVHVRDTGSGISPPDLTDVFRAQLRNNERRGEVPRGLSLFVAKQIVELHGGQMWAQSDGLGYGSTFSFSLPLRSK